VFRDPQCKSLSELLYTSDFCSFSKIFPVKNLTPICQGAGLFIKFSVETLIKAFFDKQISARRKNETADYADFRKDVILASEPGSKAIPSGCRIKSGMTMQKSVYSVARRNKKVCVRKQKM
jgi:hypothetical protein